MAEISNSIILERVTSITKALKLIKTGVFIPSSIELSHGDSCLNCFERGKKYNREIEFSSIGATILFEWTGPVVELDDLPYPINTLIRQPWRSVVPSGSTKFLRAIDVIDIKKFSWEECFPAPGWLLLSSWKRRWLLRKIKEAQDELGNLLSSRPSIRVKGEH